MVHHCALYLAKKYAHPLLSHSQLMLFLQKYIILFLTKYPHVVIKEARYDVQQGIHGLPTTAATTEASKLAGQ